MPAGRLVQHDELPLAGLDPEFRRKTQARIDDIAEQAGGIDDTRCKDRTRRRLDVPCTIKRTGQDLGIAHQLRPKRHRLREITERSGPRIDDVFSWHLERGRQMAGQARHGFPRPPGGKEIKLGNTVAPPLIGDSLQPFSFVRIPGADQRTGFDKAETHLSMDRQVFRPTCLHQFQLQTAFRGIETGMENGAVGLGGPGKDV
ncbi:hypothetical protein D3C80_683920 [compost metagenome]